MRAAARRRGLRGVPRFARRALSGLCAIALSATVVPIAQAEAQTHTQWQGRDLVAASYTEPTRRYAHGVLGDDIEHGALVLEYAGDVRLTIRLPQVRVFEDTAPRLADVDGDGMAEAVVVESHASQGARLAVYNGDGLVAATPYIGQRNRWLAPVAVADLDGDGLVELAYIDRPHLAKTLRVWQFRGSALHPLAALEGYTNHKIGERDIAGGLRDCGGGPEMIVADAQWSRVVSITYDDGALHPRNIGPHQGRHSFARALACG